MQKVILKLKNGQHKPIELHIVHVKENVNSNKEIKASLLKEENLMGKNEFLSWFGAKDCVKDKIMANYAIQDTKEIEPTQPKINHYKYIKQ